MSLEFRVLTEILNTRSLDEVTKAGLIPEDFKDPEAREIFTEVYNHWHRRQTALSVPTIASIKRRWPSFEMSGHDEEEEGSLKALVYDLKMRSFESDVRGLAEYFSEQAEENPEEALQGLKRQLDDVQYRKDGGRSLNFLGLAEQAVEHYARARDGQIYGIPWPWKPLTEDTLGKLPEKFYVFYGRMKSMKCVCKGQRILLADGSLVPIEDVPEETSVPSYTASTGKVRFAKARRVTSGTKESVEVTTESGLRLRTSKDHLYMVPGGNYKRIRDLEPGDYIATARCVPELVAHNSIIREDAHLLGLLVGDGNYTRNEVQFTSADPEVVAKLKLHLMHHHAELRQASRPIEYRIVRTDGTSNQVLDLLREVGIHGEKSTQKRVPKCIFSSTNDVVASFIAGFLDTDGTIGDRFVAWSSTSRGLLSDVQQLLTRFGVRGRIKEVLTNFGTIAYQLYVYSKEQAAILWQELAPYICLGRKRKALKRLTRIKVRAKRNVDAIPYTPELKHIVTAAKGDHEWPKTGVSKFDRTKLFTSKNRISRYRLRTLADAFGSEALRKIANDDIIWEQIDSIEDIGRIPCYDICIEDGQDPNFIVEGFVVHNTWVLLKSAADDFYKYGQRVLIWSREMEEHELSLRLTSIIGRVDYQLLKKGMLPARLRDRAFGILDEIVHERTSKSLEEDPNQRDIIILAGGNAPKDVDGLRGAVQRYKPTILYVDSFYHLITDKATPNQRWLYVAYLSEELKALAQDFGIPVVSSTQANRAGEKTLGRSLDEVADSDSIAREADLIIRIIKRKGRELYEDNYEVEQKKERKRAQAKAQRKLDEEESEIRIRRPKHEPKEKARVEEEVGAPRVGAELALILGGNRDGVLDAFTIHAVPGYNFKVINARFSSEEIKSWVDKDDRELDKEQKKQSGEPDSDSGSVAVSPKTFKASSFTGIHQRNKPRVNARG